MADWVAFTVLDRLGVARMSGETASLFALERQDLATTPLAFALDRIDEPRRFLEHARDVGAHALYRFALRLVHHLVDRHGFASVVDYLRACPAHLAERSRFERVFGQPVSDFERDVLQAMRSGASPRMAVRP
jgi:hypothetical protein